MTITELCAAIGPENIKIQNLVNNSDAMDYSKKRGGTVLKFFTDQIPVDDLMTGNPKKVGLVIWFDREAYDNAIEAHEHIPATPPSQC